MSFTLLKKVKIIIYTSRRVMEKDYGYKYLCEGVLKTESKIKDSFL